MHGQITILFPVFICLKNRKFATFVFLSFQLKLQYFKFSASVVSENNQAKIVSEYDQEIPQSQTAQTTPWHREEEPLNHHETPGRQIKQSNQLSLPHQDDCNTRMDIK